MEGLGQSLIVTDLAEDVSALVEMQPGEGVVPLTPLDRAEGQQSLAIGDRTPSRSQLECPREPEASFSGCAGVMYPEEPQGASKFECRFQVRWLTRVAQRPGERPTNVVQLLFHASLPALLIQTSGFSSSLPELAEILGVCPPSRSF